MMTVVGVPTAVLDHDGVHFTWEHTCTTVMSDGHGGTETVVFRNAETLPIGKWFVISKDPLTVKPSVHCHGCGTHGWITEGVWVPVSTPEP